MDIRTATESLTKLGLTRYEASCFTALVELGPSDPRAIALHARIPSPNAYEALRRLAARGWIEIVRRRPAIYRARRPGAIKEMVVARVDETFETLEKTFNSRPADEAELVYTQRGTEAVVSKVYELMQSAKRSIMLVSPAMGFAESPRILRMMAEAVATGIEVRVITDEQGKRLVPKGVEVRVGNVVAVDLLVDDDVALIALPDYSACGWVDSPQVAEHFKQFLELMWKATIGRPPATKS